MAKSDVLFDTSRPRIMGILNVTPDSFYDGGKNFQFQNAINRVAIMARVGADAIDIGGESTRPGSEPISVDEELNRVIPIIEAVSKRFDICISVDTRKVEVARQAVSAGAHVINDVSGIEDKKMCEFIAQANIPVIVMHMYGKPETMQMAPMEGNVVEEINEFFDKKLEQCKKQGIKKVILDPGIGFGKTFEQNLTIVKELSKLKKPNIPLMLGHSNKSFIGKITGRETDARTYGTTAVTSLSIFNGADIVRVHEIVATRDAALVARAVRDERIVPYA